VDSILLPLGSYQKTGILPNCLLPAVSYLRNVFVHLVPNDIFENKPFKNV
jgi:hypothetical protein